MPLRAVLDGIELGELLRLLAVSSDTGTLTVTAGARCASLRIESGRVALEGRDKTPELVEALFALIEAGVDTAEFSRDTSRDAEASTAAPSDSAVAVEDLLTQVSAREQEWADIRRVVPSMEAKFGLKRDSAAASGSMKLEAGEWQIICSLGIPGSATLLCRELGISALDTCRLLVRLIDKGLVEMVSSGQETVPCDAEPQADAPASLLLKGVEDVLADVTAEMEGITQRESEPGYQRRDLDEAALENVPAELESYLQWMPPADSGEAASNG